MNLQKTDIFMKAMVVDKVRQFTMNLGLSIANQLSLRGRMDKELNGAWITQE